MNDFYHLEDFDVKVAEMMIGTVAAKKRMQTQQKMLTKRTSGTTIFTSEHQGLMTLK
jgi:hypothetical protein